MVALVSLLLLGAPDLAGLEAAYAAAVEARDWDRVSGVAAAIAKLGTEEAADFLLGETWQVGPGAHRRAVVAARASMLKLPSTKEWIEELLDSDDPHERLIALEATGKLDKERHLSCACRLMRADPDEDVRRTCTAILVNSGDPRAARALVEGVALLRPDERAGVFALVGKMPPEALEGITHLATKAQPEVRLVAVRLFASLRDERFRGVLELARKDRDRRVALLALAGLDELREPGGYSAIHRVARDAKTDEDRWALYDAILEGRIRNRSLARVLEGHARAGGSPALRARAAEALGAAGGDDAVRTLALLLVKPDPWQLPIGAARGLAATRSKEAVDPLIRGLERTSGRVQHEIGCALESLTGQPLGTHAKVWQRWWDRYGAHYKVPEVPHVAKAREGDADRGYAFFGIPLHSDRAIFVCDVSGSMEGKSLDTLKVELGRVVGRFPPDGRFNFVFFESDVEAWKPRLVEAEAKAKEAALAFVNGQAARGGTNLWGGLETALKDGDIDTIVMLTDGSPTAGSITDTGEIRRAFAQINRDRMLTLHVVAIGVESPDLEAMARESGGSYARR